ncbi:MAG: PfaD family polyunsaturated fatty acid/polyketide biosynthesis protein [Hyphomonas sp.]|uniref:PfaD family polyunsaturated fatty acid/polyketide biosynthesis protein n=1 Tax=Hyphomonas sp. TaxID=87 RepID=UPI003529C2EE
MNVIDTIIDNPRVPATLTQVEDAVIARPAKGAAAAGASELPPIYPEWLGDRAFAATHGARFNYVVGEMARGIATPQMVVAAVRAGCVGFYGSAGLPPDVIEGGVREIRGQLVPDQIAWGANLIHTPQQPGYEAAVVDLFLREGVHRVSASAYMRLSPDIVRFTALGLARAADGRIERRHHVFAKVSRAEVAEQFIAPAPAKILQELVAAGQITPEQAELAGQVPVAVEITAEADSGGHTDNRAAAPLFSSISLARDRVAAKTGIDPDTVRIGLAGGIATPHGVAAAFQMGAAYVLTGSINQSAVESGLSLPARQLLAKAGPADVAMAPAADMFEQGVEVQVLKRGTLFAMRAKKLHALYRAGAAFETMDEKDRVWLEDVIGEPFEKAWADTRDYIRKANPREADKAETDGNKRLALVARRYLFQGAQWARDGDPSRVADYQIWCGPAQGAFNEWVAGTFLEDISNRTVAQIAWNLMEGAARISRAAQLRASGVAVPPSAFSYTPQHFAEPGRA